MIGSAKRLKQLGTALCLALGVAVAAQGSAAAKAPEKAVPRSAAEVQLSFAPLVAAAKPAVVNVYARRKVQRGARSPFADDPFFKHFFGDDFFGVPRERVENSLGSGVIVRENGIIVTNNHVIDKGDEFTVVLADRREFDAEVVLSEPRTDLAVLRIDVGEEKLPTLPFADSDQAQVGDLVLAIGNPFGVGQTVTSGIVSALARTRVGVTDYQFFIQTDAAINPGNSGGALISVDGELIGVNTAIYSRSGGSNGIGFAIPANMVRLVVDSAVEGREIVRPWLGADVQPVTADIARSFELDRPIGVLINAIYPKGPAAKAGLKIGDIVTHVAGFEVFDPDALRYRIGTQAVGEKADLAYIRDGKTRKARLPLSAPPENPARELTQIQGRNPFSGATIANLSPAFNEENGLDPMLRGVMVVETERGSPIRRVRMRAGDIILSVNGTDIESVAQLQEFVVEQASPWEVMYRRGDRTVTFTVRK
jgi:serine protease Do